MDYHYVRKSLLLLLSLFFLQPIVFAQNKAAISIRSDDITVRDALREVEKQSKMSVAYNQTKLDAEKHIRLNIVNQPLEKALVTILSETGFTFQIKDDYIMIVPVVSKGQPDTRRITGRITDETGQPLMGATVTIEGTSKGAATDVNGTFALMVSKGEQLSIKYVGYMTQNIKIADQSAVNVSLQPDAKSLEAVVVTALGIKRSQKALSYNVQELKAAEVLKVNDASFVNSLAGKIAGVTINSSASGIGGATRIVMRGTKSIAGNNNAMYVIDGIPLANATRDQPEDLFTGMGQSGDAASQINPDDIESMSILSGAAAAALYGADAANGVVLISTKKGQENTLSLNASNSTTFFSPFVMPRFQNTYGSESGTFNSWGDKLITPTDYDPADFFQTGYNTTNSVNLSTGNKSNQTYLSAASTNAQGIIGNNNLDRYNFSVRNSSSFLNDKFNMDLGMMYMTMKEQNMLAQGQYFNPLVPVYLFPRGDDIAKYQTYERYNVERNFKTQYWPYGNLGLGMQNPYWIINRDMFVNDKDRLMMSGALKYNITDWMYITGRAKIDKNTSKNEKKYSASTDGIFAGSKGGYYIDNYSTRQIYADAMLSVNKDLGDYSLTAVLGSSLLDVVYDETRIGSDLSSVPNGFTLNNLNTALLERSQAGYHDRTNALFATAQLGYKGMVYFDVTGRNDWLSALAYTRNLSVFYPSFGLSGVFTDIFRVKSDVLSFLKGRISYSEVGNAPGRYRTYERYPYLVTAVPATFPTMPVDLKPERTKSWEAGINSIFFNNKLKFDFTVYKSSTYDQLFNPTLSTTSGYQDVYINGGQIDNRGIEASLGFKQNLGSLLWNTGLVYSLNRNKIAKLLPYFKVADGQEVSVNELNMGGTGSYRMMLREGESMGDIYVNTLATDEHGYIIVNQVSQEVISDPNTFVYAGNVNPKYTLGWRNSFEWKGVDLSFLVNARVGGVGVSLTQALMDAYGVSEASALARDNGGALVNGQLIPARPYYSTIGGGTSGVGSMYTYSMTNVRLAELTVGYEVPASTYASFAPFVKGMNLSFVGRNLFMFYNKAPFDPELTASTGTYYQGIDYFMTPSLRNLGFSVKLRF